MTTTTPTPTYNRKPIAELRKRVSDAEALAQWERALLAQAEAEQALADERAHIAKVLGPPKARTPKPPKPDTDTDTDTDPYKSVLQDAWLLLRFFLVIPALLLVCFALGYASRWL